MARQKKEPTPRNEDGVALKKDGTINMASLRGKELVKNGTFLQKVTEAVQESKKIPETIDDEDETDSSDEETEFEITNVAEKKELEDVVEEKISKKLEFVRDTEEKTKKFLEEEKKAREEILVEKEKIKAEKEDLIKERDELRKSLEPVQKDFQSILNENRRLKKLKQQNDHLNKVATMTRKYIQL
jgi:hypothetical protein